MSSYSTLILEQTNNVVTITLNRPDKFNAINETSIAELTQACAEISANKSCHAVVIEARGKHFCAGADLNWMQKTATYTFEENKQDAMRLARMLNALATLPKPVIAKVQGSAFGGGLGILACCDFAICETNSKFSFTEVKLGLSPATIAPFVLRTINYKNTLRYFLSAELFDAEAAKNMGLVCDIAQPDQLNERVNQLLKQLSENGINAMASVKKHVQELQPIDENVLEHSAVTLAHVRSSDEAKQRITAFFAARDKK